MTAAPFTRAQAARLYIDMPLEHKQEFRDFYAFYAVLQWFEGVHNIGAIPAALPSPAWCAEVDAELAATAVEDARPVQVSGEIALIRAVLMGYPHSMARADALRACDALVGNSVTRILLDIVPGFDGMGHEVYAKTVKDIEDKLYKLGSELEDWQLGIKRLPAIPPPAALEPMTAERRRQLIGRFFAEEWAQEAANGLLDDVESHYGIKCLTCSGHGLIGGFQGGEAPGYVSEPCPDCNAPALPVAQELAAFGALLDGDSLEQAS